MKKLIYILNHYSADQGSHFYHILHLLEEIAYNGVEIVLLIEKAEGEPVFKNSNIKVIVQKETKPLKRIMELFNILKKLNKQGFKKIYIRISQNAALPAMAVSKLYGSEVYYWQSGTTHLVNDKKIKNLQDIKRLIKSDLPFYLTKKYVDHFVTGPESMADYYRDVVGVSEKRLMVLYNDIDLERFKQISAEEIELLRKELNIYGDEKIILFVHRLSPVRKSLYYMPFVLEKISDVLREHNYKCIVLGGGPEKEVLEEEIKQKKLDDIIEVLGEKPNATIQQYYQVAEIFINPTYTEGFPRVLIEAMASGLPIVTTNAGGIKDILDTKQLDYMVDINDRDMFSEQLKSLLDDKEMQKELGEENLQKVKRYSTENVAKMYIERIFNNG
ncbi:MAG TPA: glycosyltransferase family 1 protein [Lutibacter sp.]|nr:glycosyltransferase family 1 protein [Lutibacter sp.]